ncbi:MAG: four-carbon acid sugar kinase family protein, partial [Variovorax paradoxus]
MAKLLLGCIADDFTGATDLANNLVRAGMRVVQAIGVPATPLDAEVDAVVVALKSRTIAPAEAIAQSLEALRWLQAQGAQQIYFKYCSTFDSTPQGNIGPVTEALMEALKCGFTIATPAFPDNKRTVFKGYLFAGDVLLNESGMQNHPLTPMTDPNLVRVLQAQCTRKVGLIDHAVVARGAAAVTERIEQLQGEGVSIAIVDAVSNDDLLRLGPALAKMPLVTAGSGVAIGLPANFGLAPSSQASALPTAGGLRAVVSGSCSLATNRQVLDFIQRGGAALAVDPLRIAAGVDVAAEALAWAAPLVEKQP